MSEQNKPFVVTDRRKFTSDGTPRPDADPSPEREAPAAVATEAPTESKPAAPEQAAAAPQQPAEPELPPPPTAQEMEQANAAYQETSDRLNTAVRAANPGMEHPPAMSFGHIVHSIYMTTIMQLGGTAPEEGQQPKIDLMGARQSIDMLSVLADKTKGNLASDEQQLLDNALFEVRMGFLEVTQALARQAANRQPPPGAPGRPSIVR
jgi:Domain of unknown function (DUF1844)